jgi:hypothetical protein
MATQKPQEVVARCGESGGRWWGVAGKAAGGDGGFLFNPEIGILQTIGEYGCRPRLNPGRVRKMDSAAINW